MIAILLILIFIILCIFFGMYIISIVTNVDNELYKYKASYNNVVLIINKYISSMHVIESSCEIKISNYDSLIKSHLSLGLFRDNHGYSVDEEKAIYKNITEKIINLFIDDIPELKHSLRNDKLKSILND